MTHAPMGRAGCVRCKDAGSLDSSAIEATEDAAACVHSAFQRPVLIQSEVLARVRDEDVLVVLACAAAGAAVHVAAAAFLESQARAGKDLGIEIAPVV